MSLWIIISIFNLFASDVVIQSSTSDNYEYQKYLQDNSGKISFITHITQNISQNNQLSTHLKKAQYEFLKGSLERAKNEFKDIVELRFKNDWNNEQRKVINYSFLRLAQLERNKKNQMDIVKTALLFDKSYTPSKELFPPTLLHLYKRIRKQLNEQIWSLPENANKYDSLLINGRLVDFSSGFIKKESGVVRLSFLSNKWLPQTYILNTQEIESINLPTIPMVKGSCHNPIFNTVNHLKESPTVFENGCVGNVQTQLANLPIDKIRFNPSSTSEKTVSKFYHSKWFWIGASVLAVGLTAYHFDQQSQSGSPRPQGSPPQASKDPIVFSNN